MRYRFIHLPAMCLVLLAAGSAWAGPKREVPASVKEYLANSVHGGRYVLSELVHSGVKDGRMTVEITLPKELAELADKGFPQTQPVKIDIVGSDFTWSVKSYGEAGDKRTVALACYDTEALLPFQCVALHVSPTSVKVYGATFDRPGTSARLELTQSGDGLSFSWLLPGAGEQSGRVANLAELRQKYAKFTQLTLSPVVRRVGLRGFVRRHPAGEVYKAFPSIDPDVEVSKKLNTILPRLAAAKVKEREAASADLTKLGRPGVLAVLRLDRELLSSEQNSRLDLFLRWSGEIDLVEVKPNVDDLDFLIDCLDDDDVRIRNVAKVAVEAKLKHAIDFDTALTGDARAEAVDRLYEHLEQAKPTTRPGK